MKGAATLVLVMLAMSASAAVDARALASEGRKTQWAPTRNFSSLNAHPVFAGESRRATSPYAGEAGETAAGAKEAGFTGHRTEAALGLTYAKRRWLDSSTGTWLSRDDIGAASYLQSPNELNPWQYAAGNPIRYTDPDGRCLPGMGLAECVTFDTAFVGSYAKRRQELGMQGAVDLLVGPLKAVDALVACVQEANVSACGPFRFTIGMDQSEKEALASLFAKSSGWDDLKAGFEGRDPVLMGRGYASMQYEFEQFANMVAGTAAGALGELPTAPAPARVALPKRAPAVAGSNGPLVPPGMVPAGGVPPPMRIRGIGKRTSQATVDDVVGRNRPLQAAARGPGGGQVVVVRPEDLRGGKHAADRPLRDVIAEAGQPARPPHPRAGTPVPIGKWSSVQAAEAAAQRINPALGRQVVELQPGEGTVVYGGVNTYPPDPARPRFEILPADRALAIPIDGEWHIFPIDSSHQLHGPAGPRPMGGP